LQKQTGVCDRLAEFWFAGVGAVAGERVVAAALANDPPFEPDLVVAVGKAASSMCRGALSSVTEYGRAIVVTKYGHAGDALAEFRNVSVLESGHPLPDQRSIVAGEILLEAIKGLGPGSRLLFLLSGGASALAEILPDDMELAEWQDRTEKMIGSGMTIEAINAERKKVSRIKDGKLLQYFRGKAARVYAISDVEGDDLAVIGSGLGQLIGPECEYDASVIGTNGIARASVAAAAIEAGLPVRVNQESLYDDVFELAPHIAETLREGEPGVYIWGGEPTVRLPDKPGDGGRNQSLALAIARGIKGRKEIAVLVAGTDGTDGPTDAAGACIDGDTCDDLAAAEDALAAADAGTFLGARGSLFVTGATHTNVMDLVVALVQ
jgi:glycerate 2-kinase